ncbi:hypothetical protein [uncultured Tateyamaria sp.]|uniref:hypothetical protein n=1 Tax=uncultured Tateyamaria sp. TaxID=455651 RepID=UPI0026268D6B|nr:hypothetical protein [uncultured Tateyamaria sp.]
MFSPVFGFAQGLDIQPIGIELASEGDELVLAALPSATTGPVFSGLIESAGVVQAAVRTPGTLPKPSIILGVIGAGQEEEFGIERLLPATVEEVAFSVDDLAAREAMRAENPDLFRRLIEEGHLDPEADQLNRALQIELARMNCYRSGIDGAWGPGSRRSVGEYFQQLASVTWDDPQPSNSLFRAIIINGDVACPTPVAAARPAPTPRATTTQRTTTTRRAPVPAPRAAAPAPAAKPKPKLSIGGSGVFR